ncbi:hypothetical protein, partial [Staphylococcus aureus]|uniref:hypothetical protein n=1 Tax=Staphylococcus aureus TaxID=1280 RepID=UPI001F1D0917
MSTLGFIDINKAPFKVFIFSMSTLKGAFQKTFPSVRFIIEPLYIVRSPPKFIGPKKITASAFTTPTVIDLKHKKTTL